MKFPNGLEDEDGEGDDDAGDHPDVDEFQISWERAGVSYKVSLGPVWLLAWERGFDSTISNLFLQSLLFKAFCRKLSQTKWVGVIIGIAMML